MISIILADDHPIVRQGLRDLLRAETDFHVMAEAQDGLEVIELAEQLQPDVLVLDLMMPGLGGLEVTRLIRQRVPGTHVIILSMHADESYVFEALKNGAAGYILKDSTTSDLVQAIRAALAGERFLSPPLSDQGVEAYFNKAKGGELDRYKTLTTRERQVLQLAAEGRTNAQIATRLTIGRRTVENHRANMMRKLKLRQQTELVRYAIRKGILRQT